MHQFSKSLLVLSLLIKHNPIEAQDFPIVQQSNTATIVFNKGAVTDSVAANLLADDIDRVTRQRPGVVTNINKAKGFVIALGQLQSPLMKRFIQSNSSFGKKLQNKWECFGYKVISNPTANITKALIIAGSDVRGTAYGVFTLSEKIGVSPWYWWADVPVQQHPELIIQQPEFISSTPSVKYRGIFINDEDWGLRPWAANTFEKEKKNIGPKTYAQVFELLLRLKANLLWPAMHPGTEPFFNDPENIKIAAAYSIIVGSSHAEPMLRNNVGEWNEKTMGNYNYITNKEKILNYWKTRVKETGGAEVMYTMGMRGVHDSQMEGVKTVKEAVPLLEQIIKDQRALLKKYGNNKSTPQVFTAYKEVLDIYDGGLNLPDDITIIWPDDNYGYIQRLNNDAEKKRSGGSGVYYHASYWGRPHDYLWLSTTHPALIREEMTKAYKAGADRIWVLNVGDIKPLEYNINLFMDMAYNVQPFMDDKYTRKHLLHWHESIFGKEAAEQITMAMWEYYRLAFERRPEFMGWSQTEPTTETKLTAFNHLDYGDEAEKRVHNYELLVFLIEKTRDNISLLAGNAYFELVYYPIVCATAMNKKFLYRDKAWMCAKQDDKISTAIYSELSTTAYEDIIKETERYNNLRGGKWKDMMSMKPRDLPAFKEPVLPALPQTDDSMYKPKIAFLPKILSDSNAKTKSFVEENGYLSIYANHFTGKKDLANFSWEEIDGIGYTGISMIANQFLPAAPDTGDLLHSAVLSYEFSTLTDTTPIVWVYTIPTHPLNKNYSMRYAMSIDDSPPKIMDFKTVGRSEEWKQNVLRNNAIRQIQFPLLKKGKHILRIYAIDPGVILDRIEIDLGGLKDHYSALPETGN